MLCTGEHPSYSTVVPLSVNGLLLAARHPVISSAHRMMSCDCWSSDTDSCSPADSPGMTTPFLPHCCVYNICVRICAHACMTAAYLTVDYVSTKWKTICSFSAFSAYSSETILPKHQTLTWETTVFFVFFPISSQYSKFISLKTWPLASICSFHNDDKDSLIQTMIFLRPNQTIGITYQINKQSFIHSDLFL